MTSLMYWKLFCLNFNSETLLCIYTTFQIINTTLCNSDRENKKRPLMTSDAVLQASYMICISLPIWYVYLFLYDMFISSYMICISLLIWYICISLPIWYVYLFLYDMYISSYMIYMYISSYMICLSLPIWYVYLFALGTNWKLHMQVREEKKGWGLSTVGRDRHHILRIGKNFSFRSV